MKKLNKRSLVFSMLGVVSVVAISAAIACSPMATKRKTVDPALKKSFYSKVLHQQGLWGTLRDPKTKNILPSKFIKDQPFKSFEDFKSQIRLSKALKFDNTLKLNLKRQEADDKNGIINVFLEALFADESVEPTLLISKEVHVIVKGLKRNIEEQSEFLKTIKMDDKLLTEDLAKEIVKLVITEKYKTTLQDFLAWLEKVQSEKNIVDRFKEFSFALDDKSITTLNAEVKDNKLIVTFKLKEAIVTDTKDMSFTFNNSSTVNFTAPTDDADSKAKFDAEVTKFKNEKLALNDAELLKLLPTRVIQTIHLKPLPGKEEELNDIFAIMKKNFKFSTDGLEIDKNFAWEIVSAKANDEEGTVEIVLGVSTPSYSHQFKYIISGFKTTLDTKVSLLQSVTLDSQGKSNIDLFNDLWKVVATDKATATMDDLALALQNVSGFNGLPGLLDGYSLVPASLGSKLTKVADNNFNLELKFKIQKADNTDTTKQKDVLIVLKGFQNIGNATVTS
ncbi:lipoprotein 17-related variable surface protein [Mycoplasmopsis agassizii]|uniref:Lipoprotein-associated type-17 domain-containing protein n=1 Tax=Mycoplasmopsis agassizii TaxID=33922 RepID=A0ABX4H4R1_9BACT|nr:lipoprotein 17-related variable surface protein [Mycoplasmopsis agassizii]PAF54876.1 hypothetical protein CJF60_04025 [Mycoplasmopsis agassizii]SMC20021.1 Lipoprotein associated domain-containing protein [Mycoplasmopsis agassizii]